MNFLPMISIGFFNPLMQIFVICIIFIATVFVQHRAYKKSGKIFTNYPPTTIIFFAPIYEEVIFRGIILSGLIYMYGIVPAIIITSILFGVWHIRSIFFMSSRKTLAQILYTALILGPIFATLTIHTGSIWLAVILHFLNNLFAPILENKP